MKKTTITISYDEDKLSALRLYLEQKDQSVEAELTAAADSLFSKVVPANVREFLDLRSGLDIKPAEKKRRAKPPAPAAIPTAESRDDD